MAAALHPLEGLTVELRLRLLLAGLFVILFCSVGLFAVNTQSAQADRAVHAEVDDTLRAMQSASRAKAALIDLRRAMTGAALLPVAEISVPAVQAAVSLRMAEVHASSAALALVAPSIPGRIGDTATEIVQIGMAGVAAIAEGQARAGMAHLSRIPQIDMPVHQTLDQFFAMQQQSLRNGLARATAEQARLQTLANALHVIILILGFTLSLMVLHAVFRPLQSLYEALGEVASGRALPHPPVRGSDEFGQLGKALYDLSQFTAELKVAAYQDRLTGLPNRAQFERDIASWLESQKTFALMLGDVDHFRTINDGYGHQFGDLALKALARRLQLLIGRDARIYRYSGDLFAICMTRGAMSAAEFRPHVAQQAERLRLAMAKPLMVENRSLSIRLSLGLALCRDDGDSVDALLSAADAALFDAKKMGRNNVQFARSDYASKARRRLELADELRTGLQTGALNPYFQPVVDLGSGAIVCAEALARWKHPTRGFISPEEFIGIAEDSGQIDALTEQLLRKACASAVDWQALRGHAAPKLAFNLSARQLRDGLVEMIASILADTGLPAHRLEIEITESAIIERPEAAERLLREVRALGVTVALDDFGTGYSSLTYLLRFPIDKIKVDRSFVAQLNGQRQAGKIVAATISLAADLEITLVAEGVETIGQMVTLYELGCRQQQGWLYAKALPAEAFSHWAAEAPLRLDAVVRAQADCANDLQSAAA